MKLREESVCIQASTSSFLVLSFSFCDCEFFELTRGYWCRNCSAASPPSFYWSWCGEGTGMAQLAPSGKGEETEVTGK